jgi:RimJ/RimL family protein N-acetyltransferase
MEPVRTFTEKQGLEITIRPAQPGDSCAIIDTVRSNALERSYVLMEQYGKDETSEREYIRGLDAARNLLAVATAGGEVVGCLAVLQADAGRRPETAHILHVGLHLREPFRGRGIGSALLAYGAEWAAAAGFAKLETSIFTTNQRSLHLFLKAGFVEEGVRHNRIRIGRDFIDEVLLGKVLAPGAPR